jgi:hypothetical protein
LIDRDADQLPAVGHQHELVGAGHRERGDDRTVALGSHDVGQALAAAIGQTVLVGRGALAEAVRGDRQDQLLGRLELRQPLRRQHSLAVSRVAVLLILVRRGGDGFVLCASGAPARIGQAQIGVALGWGRLDMTQDGHGDDLVVLLQSDAAYADGIPPAEHPDLGDRETDAAPAAGGQ